MDSVMLFVCPQLLLQHYCYCWLLDCCRFQVPTSTGARPPLPVVRGRGLMRDVSDLRPRVRYSEAATAGETEKLLKHHT